MAVKTPKVRGFRTVKKDILKLIDTYVECAVDLETVNRVMVEPFLEAVLSDFNANADVARDPEVLSTIATLANTLRVSMFANLY